MVMGALDHRVVSLPRKMEQMFYGVMISVFKPKIEFNSKSVASVLQRDFEFGLEG
jgi:hypothetical protein